MPPVSSFLRVASALVLAGLTSACAGSMPATMTPDFVVSDKMLSIPVNVSGDTFGQPKSRLDDLVRQAMACGLQRATPAVESAYAGHTVRMLWSIRDAVKSDNAAVWLRTQTDGAAEHIEMKRIGLRKMPQPLFVRDMCIMTADALVAMKDSAQTR